MNKEVILIGIFLLFIFIVSFAAHMLYVEGYAFERAKNHLEQEKTISIYQTQEACEKDTHGKCVLQMCDDIPAGREFEDICGQGFKNGWQPKSDHGTGH